jgi:hypothetical protein
MILICLQAFDSNLINVSIPLKHWQGARSPRDCPTKHRTPTLKSTKFSSRCIVSYYSPFCAAYCLSSAPGGAATKRLSRSSAAAGGAMAAAEEPAIAFCGPPGAGFDPCVDLPDLAFSILVSRSMESKGFGRPHCTRSGTPLTNARPWHVAAAFSADDRSM